MKHENQSLWDGRLLAHHVVRAYRVALGVRQCQRLFNKMGFRLRKPRPVIAQEAPELRAAYKKRRMLNDQRLDL